MRLTTSPATISVIRFIAAGLVAVAIISAGGYWVVSRNSVAEATRNAQEIASIDGRGIVGPALTDAVLAGDPSALAGFDRLIRDRVLSSRVIRIKLWTLEGKVVYSDITALTGQVFGLDDEELLSIRGNRVVAKVSELAKPENRYERGYGPLLEVYLPVVSVSGRRFLFETYQIYASINDDERRIWSSFFPVLLGAIALLFVIQVPLAWRLATSLESARRQQEALLVRALDASAAERRRIARDLHDGVVQSLAGVAFSLGGGSARATSAGERDLAADLKTNGQVIRQAIRDLRSLIVEIAAPDLEGKRLEGALAELLLPLETGGLQTSLDVSGIDSIGREQTALLYRAAQEAVRNAAAHSGATRVEVTARAEDGEAVLRIHDDGRGFTAEEVIGRRREGHVGLEMLKSLVEDGGGELLVSSTPEAGSTIEVRVPR